MENIELYLIAGLVVFTLWFIFNTKKFYFGEKRKLKNLHHFAKEGDVEAQQELARHYDKAAFWYQKAALSGDEKAKGYLQKFLDNRKTKC